jgi:hypothetical protein
MGRRLRLPSSCLARKAERIAAKARSGSGADGLPQPDLLVDLAQAAG